jgi:hypothetical protein
MRFAASAQSARGFRTSSFQFRRSADVVKLAGSCVWSRWRQRTQAGRVRITAQLINSADGFNLWSESYDRNLEDTFAIQTEIAQRLTKALQLSLSPRETQLLERGGTRNVAAYDLYLRGQQLLRRYSESTAEQAAVLFRDAIGHDAVLRRRMRRSPAHWRSWASGGRTCRGRGR